MMVRTLIAALILAGCVGGGPEPAEPAPTPAAPTPEPAANQTIEIQAPVELHNATYAYPGPNDPPLSDDFSVPEGIRALDLAMHAWGDCPAYAGAQDPAVTISAPNGGETVMDTFGGNSGFEFVGRCSSATTGQEYLGVSEADAAGEDGSWSIGSRGSFTGDVQIVVTGRFA